MEKDAVTSWWKKTPSKVALPPYTERYMFMTDPHDPKRQLRVLKLVNGGEWAIRWGQGNPTDQYIMPPETPLEEVQAMAIALWRMK